jgi:hypothetical protein
LQRLHDHFAAFRPVRRGGQLDAVTTLGPKVQYAYNLMAGGANNSRLFTMTYPNSRVINYNYNTGLDSSRRSRTVPQRW